MLEKKVALPSKPRIVSEEDNRGVYEIDGLYPGYGHTLGNSLRRIILSSLAGAAITRVKIDGVAHEFSTIQHVKEEVITILLNLKRIRFAMHSEEPLVMQLSVSGQKDATAGDIVAPSQIEILNPEQPIASVTHKSGSLSIEMTVEHGLGYVPREVHTKEKVEVGTIALDAVFTPVRRANYEVENMRVGDRTDYNRLRLSIETDGTITPHEALEQSIETMLHQLKAIIGFQEAEPIAMSDSVPPAVPEHEQEDEVPLDADMLKTRIETLNLTTRTQHALETASIRTVGGLVRKKKDDILALDGIGQKGFEEIEAMLASLNASLKG